MLRTAAAALLVLLAPTVRAQSPWDAAKKAAGQSTIAKLEKELNRRLLDESRKNQCSFRSGTAELEKGAMRRRSASRTRSSTRSAGSRGRA